MAEIIAENTGLEGDQKSSYTFDDLTVSTFNSCDLYEEMEFEAWVRGLTLELDNEPGDAENGTYDWVLENNSAACGGRPYATFIFRERSTNQIVASASFVADDRGVAKQLGLDTPEYLGIWGFFQVRRELRNRRLGTVISQYVDDYVQAYVNGGTDCRTVYLFTSVPQAMRIYERLGFERQDASVNVPGFGFEETLFKKTYTPKA